MLPLPMGVVRWHGPSNILVHENVRGLWGDMASVSTTQDELRVRCKSIILACNKAVGKLIEHKLASSCLMAAAVAAKILTRFHVKYTAVAGYWHMEGLPYSFPHVWLATGEDAEVTDLVYSTPDRMITILGTAMPVTAGHARAPMFTAQPKLPVFSHPNMLSLDRLLEVARELDSYLASAPEGLQVKIKDVLDTAFDPSATLTLHLTQDTLNDLQLVMQDAAAAQAECHGDACPVPADDH